MTVQCVTYYGQTLKVLLYEPRHEETGLHSRSAPLVSLLG